MLVSMDKARQTLARWNEPFMAPGLHPFYVAADAVRDKNITPVFFLYEEDGDFFYHGVHLAPVKDTPFFDLQSPLGYGGPLCNTGSRAFLNRAWSVYDDFCREQRVLAEFIRFHPLMSNWQYYKGNVHGNRETVWIDLTVDCPLQSYRGRARTAVRRAMKNGLRVEWWNKQDFIKVFPGMYNDLMVQLQAEAAYFFSASYFHSLLDWDQTHMAVCLLDGRAEAAAIFLQQEALLEYHLSVSTLLGKKLNASHLLLHEAVLMGQRLGCKALHLGGGTDQRSDNQLLFFKSGFSKQRAVYRIGTRVHLQSDYDRLQKEYCFQSQQDSERFLFYR